MLHTETYRLPFRICMELLHCPKNNLNLRMTAESDTAGTEATVQYTVYSRTVHVYIYCRHTVASAPNVTGSGFMQRFRLFLGQCALCMVGFPFEPVARFSLAFICLVDLMEWWWYQRRSSAAVYSQLYIYSNLHHHTKWFSFSKCISWIASIY